MMGIENEADRRLESARVHVRMAIDELTRIVMDEAEGVDTITDSHKKTVDWAHRKLLKIYKAL